MAAGRPPPVCTLCQARYLSIRRWSQSGPAKRRQHTAVATLRPDHDSFSPGLVASVAAGHCDDVSSSFQERVRNWRLGETIGGFREAVLSLDQLWQQRDRRTAVLRKLRNPFPERPTGKKEQKAVSLQNRIPILPEAKAALVPPAVFRQIIKKAQPGKPRRTILRAQLLGCEWPRDMLRIVAVAMMEPPIAEQLATLHEPITRAAYRCRQNVSDPEILGLLTTIITRFQHAKLPVEHPIMFMALKFAARARSLPGMQRYLRNLRQANVTMSSILFRSIIAKCSIGHRGFGEIRNGRWKQKDLIKVLTGFDDETHLAPQERSHLGVFLDRSDWKFLSGWVAILARCKDTEAVWREWLLWKSSPMRLEPRPLVFSAPGLMGQMTTRIRGEFFFVEQVTLAGDLERAWQIIEETGIPLSSLKSSLKDKLLESPEFATTPVDETRQELIAKYDRDLRRIEEALGVRWVPRAGGEDGEGHHELFMDQEEALEKLGEDGWKLKDDHGYPWETDAIAQEHEKRLHNAPVSQD